jgi:hypothetical protein
MSSLSGVQKSRTNNCDSELKVICDLAPPAKDAEMEEW